MSRLTSHLRAWLGAWPPPAGRLVVVGSLARVRPGWDGKVHSVVGVSSADGAGVLSVPPDVAAEVGDLPPSWGLTEIGRLVAQAQGREDSRIYAGAFRWCDTPPSAADLPDAGEWVEADDPRVPEWLRPFNGGVLLALEDDRYVAGVGIKRHDDFGREISVGTEPEARGRGLARRLVAQAARRIIDDGALPTYLHAFDNHASAKVADAAGFPERGWRVLGMSPNG